MGESSELCLCGHQRHVHFDKVKAPYDYARNVQPPDHVTPGGRCRGRKCGCKKFALRPAAGASIQDERWIPQEGEACMVRRVEGGHLHPGEVLAAANGVVKVRFRTAREVQVKNFLTETMKTLFPANWELFRDENEAIARRIRS
jgi:hypothetical protein